jgi:DNA repair protein RecO (recombination protein O)
LEGIIYKTTRYDESSLLLFVFTKNGKYSLLAKGALNYKSEYRTVSQYLTLLSFEADEKKRNLQNLKSPSLINNYNTIKTDMKLYKTVSNITLIIDKFLLDEKIDPVLNTQIYNLVINTLSSNNIKLSTLSFLFNILRLEGYALDLIPKNKKVKGISIKEGSIIYEDSEVPVDLNLKDSTVLLKLYYNQDIENIICEKQTYNNIVNFCYQYYLLHTSLQLDNLLD